MKNAIIIAMILILTGLVHAEVEEEESNLNSKIDETKLEHINNSDLTSSPYSEALSHDFVICIDNKEIENDKEIDRDKTNESTIVTSISSKCNDEIVSDLNDTENGYGDTSVEPSILDKLIERLRR